MYLTRMSLNGARRGARKLLSSPQAMHAAVLSSFPPGASQESGRVLWRLDRNDNALALYVSSSRRPDLTHVIEQAGWPSLNETWQTVDISPFLGRLEAGQRWAFRVTGNPTHAVREGERGRGKVMAHVTVDQQIGWLLQKAERHGFVVPSNVFDEPELRLHDRRVHRFARRSDGAERTVVLGTATFDGVLEVVDPEALRAAIVDGIGRAKGYGCGLLTLAPPPG